MLFKQIKTQSNGVNWLWLLAEFFILVIGFFIGMQVNDWEDRRSERELEAEYLNRLLVDFEQSHAQMQADVSKMEAYVRKLDAGIDVLSEETLSDAQHQTVFEAVSVSGFYGKFNIIFGTLEELKDTGNMRLLRSTDLRIGLAKLWQEYQQVIRLSDIRTLYRVETSSQLSMHLYPEKGTDVGWDTASVENNRRGLYSGLMNIKHNQAADIADSKKLLSLLDDNMATIRAVSQE